MTRTPSLDNPTVQTTPPGTRCSDPLHGILTGMAQPTSTYTATYTVLHGVTLIMNIKWSASTSISHLLLHLIRRCNPCNRNQKFCMVQWFRLDLTQGFQWYPTQVFPTQFRTKVWDWIQLSLPESIRPKVFDWIWLRFPDLIWLTVFKGIWLRFFWFDSTHV